MPFPANFTWGAAAASYQIEGAAQVDGRAPSVWDAFCRVPGKIYHGDTGDIACDHYHHYKEDVSLMKQLGLKAYRLSLSWSRLIPEGTGAANPKGLAFYNALIDELLSAGITPWVTIYHWDLPLALHRRGGWLNPHSPLWFEDYTRLVVESFSDRVSQWMTINEPQVFLQLGYVDGVHAPGLRVDWPDALQMSHNVLLAHGRSARLIRDEARVKPFIGYAPVGCAFIPASDRAEDIEAARKLVLGCHDKGFLGESRNFWSNTWFSDPIFFGSYPEDGLRLFGSDMPEIKPDDMKLIAQPLDFYGMNTYFASCIRQGKDGHPEEVPFPDGSPHTLTHWQVTPEALYWTPKFLYERYQKPIYITENGLSCMDWVHEDGKVHDPQRIDFTGRYLKQVRRAIEDGVDIRGYFHWSILDNFEWAEGYRQRFGLIYVDYPTGKRIPKDSFDWYRGVIASNGNSL